MLIGYSSPRRRLEVITTSKCTIPLVSWVPADLSCQHPISIQSRGVWSQDIFRSEKTTFASSVASLLAAVSMAKNRTDAIYGLRTAPSAIFQDDHHHNCHHQFPQMNPFSSLSNFSFGFIVDASGLETGINMAPVARSTWCLQSSSVT